MTKMRGIKIKNKESAKSAKSARVIRKNTSKIKMKIKPKYLFTILITSLFSLTMTAQKDIQKDKKHIAPKPLFRDPIYDGAADPTIIWNEKEKKWFMFYTNRSAKDSTAKGITWVHGTQIGVATSEDGAKWTYKDTCTILNINKRCNVLGSRCHQIQK